VPKRYSYNLPRSEKLKTALVKTAGLVVGKTKSPDEVYGDLFHDVQSNRIYEDSKSFNDLMPRGSVQVIKQEYMLEKDDPEFDLRDFVTRNFYQLETEKNWNFVADQHDTVEEHISKLWVQLKKRNRLNRGSLLALPYPYIVPGGRFSEQFYWDTYFIMLGLAEDKEWKTIEGILKNYVFMIRKYGFIPTANRTYLLSRSQPPFFSHMIELFATHAGHRRVFSQYLPYMLAEYRFWMKGTRRISYTEHNAYSRVVKMPNGSHLNRYYDNKTTPRPESMYEDTSHARDADARESERFYLHIRAAAESGWDFSSRWFLDPSDIKTIHTADIVPVDLNCLLYHLEKTIANAYRLIHTTSLARKFDRLAAKRADAILRYCWDDEEQFFGDYNFHHCQPTGRLSVAGVFPLYVGIATDKQAALVAGRIEKDFLKPGGLVTTLIENGQQWDAPNGWAPMQWVAIKGLRRYGYDELADTITQRWVSINKELFHDKHKLIEKYDVENDSALGGGGEYPLQDGFGWTNGVLQALLAEYESAKESR
jgi:alpha,alpha-trehalase